MPVTSDGPAGRLGRFPLTILTLGVAGDWAAQSAIGTAYGVRPLILALILVLTWRAPARLRIGVAALLVATGALGELAAGVASLPIVLGTLACAIGIALAESVRRLEPAVVRRTALTLLTLLPLLLPFGRWIGEAEDDQALSVAVLSSVPLGPIADRAGRNAQLFSNLRAVGSVTLLDRVPDGGPGAERLVLLQPRRLDPAELIAIDRWVRAGGQALVLADPALSWSGEYPLGDPRNPLPVSLLDPLLEHWGVRLELGDRNGGKSGPFSSTSGFFSLRSSDCELSVQAIVALCHPGRGRALMVADADWLDPAGWRAGDRQPQRIARAVRSLSVADGNGAIARWPWLLLLAAAFAVCEQARSKSRTRQEQTVRTD